MTPQRKLQALTTIQSGLKYIERSNMKSIIKLEESEIEALKKIGDVDCISKCSECPFWVEGTGGFDCVSALCNGVLNKAKENNK